MVGHEAMRRMHTPIRVRIPDLDVTEMDDHDPGVRATMFRPRVELSIECLPLSAHLASKCMNRGMDPDEVDQLLSSRYPFHTEWLSPSHGFSAYCR